MPLRFMNDDQTMKPIFVPALALALLLLCGSASSAEEAEHGVAESASLALYFDNDAFSGPDKDQDDTGGLALSFATTGPTPG
jgi:hypothetical protein